MNKKQLKLLIKEILSEIDDEIEGNSYEEDDIWAGSDIEGIKQHGTGMPHGMGYSGWRRKNKLTRKDLRKILHINYIEGVSKEDEIKQNKIAQQSTYNFIKKEMPWVFDYQYKEENPQWNYEKNAYDPLAWHHPFSSYFENRNWSGSWPEYFVNEVRRHLENHKYWISFDKNQLKGQARRNPHWIKSYRDAREEQKLFPMLEKDFERLIELLYKLTEYEPTNPKNPSSYPIYVSLYDTTQNLGGHEEGGWWYDKNDLVHSIPVRNYQEMRKAAVVLLKLATDPNSDLNGKPSIILEKISDNRGNKPPPTYS